MTRLSPSRRLVFLFFVLVFFVRLFHSYFSVDYHLDGDISLPWLMANDWDTTSDHRFFWGQAYMGTQEVWVLKELGRLIFSQGPIPFFLSAVLGQLLFASGVALIYASLLKIRFSFWSRKPQFWKCGLLLGFAAPCFQKYTFGVGNGYTSLPLAYGLSFYLSTLLISSAFERSFFKFFQYIFLGGVLGLMISVSRINLVPAIVPGVIFLGKIFLLWRTSSRKQGVKRFFLEGLSVLLGLGVGLFPELLQGMTRNVPSQFKFEFSLGILQNVLLSLGLSGVSLGILPFGWFEGEHALWFRSHADFPHALIWFLILVSGLAFVFLIRNTLKKTLLKEWLFPLGVILANLSLIAVISPALEDFSARRYAYPLFFSLSIFILSFPAYWLNRVLLGARIVGLSFYLIFSVGFVSPLSDLNLAFSAVRFDSEKDCLIGHAGDITPTFAKNGFVSKMVDTAEWRVTGNFSGALPLSLGAIRKECSRAFLLETGTGAIEKLEASAFCFSILKVFTVGSTNRSFQNLNLMGTRPVPVSLSECLLREVQR